MHFYLHAQDRAGVGAELVARSEEHWSYMDRFADRLVLRGPTLSDDGEEHTGSVHVVDLSGRADAERFGHEEPFWRAGLYADIVISRTVVLRSGATGTSTALVTGRWSPARHRTDGLTVPDGSRVDFLATLVDDESARTTGIVAAVSAPPDEAVSVVQPLADRLAGRPVTLTAHRWQRGGRS
ncbi:YciI family protein [Streptomyces sp. NPDC088789]|uniref:YciI family protein n=1 Tax=Streptomyces sp. NPDC088789 TaxID=3365899 RepID=UPI0038066286